MTLDLNSTLLDIPRSGLRSVTEKAQLEYSHYSDLILLGYGQPIDPPSERLCEAIQEAGSLKLTKYTPNQGTQEFREAVVAKMARSNVFVTDQEVFAVPGATYGLAIVLGCILNPGDEVLIPDPGYPNFTAITRHYGGIPNYYRLDKSSDFQIDVDALREKIGYRTKAIILNTPSNPTGAVQSPETVKALVELAEERGIWLVCDEVYDELIYDVHHYSPLQTDSERVIGVFSLSKTYNLCGIRLGYVICRSKKFLSLLLNAQEFYISCAPSIGQHVGAVALTECHEYVETLRRSFASKAARAMEVLPPELRYNIGGAFYVMIDTGNLSQSSLQLSLDLLDEEHVAVAPGSTFGPMSDHYLRISLIAEEDEICEGVTRILSFLRRKHELVKGKERSGHWGLQRPGETTST